MKEPAYAAFEMLELFASAGADRFDVTLTSLQGEKIRYRPNLETQDVRCKISKSLERAQEQQQNIIIRPRVSDKSAFFVQLDDLNDTQLLKVQSAALLTIETSPGNFQAWMAIAADKVMPEKEIGSALRRSRGADISASGATRLAGSRNYKEKYAPDYPTITISHSSPGLVMTTQQLQAMGLLTIPSRMVPKPILRNEWMEKKPKRFPDYDRCLQNAPTNTKGDGQDTSRADYTWCMIAIDWGWSVEETAAQLLRERTDDRKRHRNTQRYAEATARSAANGVERNRMQGR
ncbi:MAG: DNA-primase RepB domain-containing protein [Nostoc sp.]|uniref:DNA-primase RepB domain-containing protein n=1 Tax=Nostoc sp. TaxID=1180 RepID=UPI002FF3F322